MNLRDDVHTLADDEAVYIDNALPGTDGLEIGRGPAVRAWLTDPPSGAAAIQLVNFQGTTSASDALYAYFGARIYNVGEVIATSVTATCSFISSPSNLSNVDSHYIQLNDRILMFTGRGEPLQFDVTNGWHILTASVSGAAAPRMTTGYNGVTQFKSRIYIWDTDYSGFAYSSVDQFKGTFESFDLSNILGEKVVHITSMTRDGGSGPDDFFVIIGEYGKVAVYQGSNPGDATDWALVGIYQIGRPAMHKCAVSYGAQVFVLCEDDVYVLPDDLQGKRSHSKAAFDRRGSNQSRTKRNGVYWPAKDVIIWSDATALSVKNGFSFTQIKTGFSNLDTEDSGFDPSQPAWDISRSRLSDTGLMEVHRGRLYAGIFTNGSGANPVYEIFPQLRFQTPGEGPFHASIVSKPISLSGRTTISLVNPVFAVQPEWSATAGGGKIRYRTAIEYDNEHVRYAQWSDSASATSASLWLTTSVSGNSKGMWTPGFGTGDVAQIRVEVISASAQANLILKYIDITIEDTGGL
jgi:hypothetical protein